MVTRYGMSEALGSRTYAPPQPFLTGTTATRVEASEATEREIDTAVRDIVHSTGQLKFCRLAGPTLTRAPACCSRRKR